MCKTVPYTLQQWESVSVLLYHFMCNRAWWSFWTTTAVMPYGAVGWRWVVLPLGQSLHCGSFPYSTSRSVNSIHAGGMKTVKVSLLLAQNHSCPTLLAATAAAVP